MDVRCVEIRVVNGRWWIVRLDGDGPMWMCVTAAQGRENDLYCLCRGGGSSGGRGPVAFSSRSSPLQIWASIIIDPARAVGGRHFLPLILGRAGVLPTYLLRSAGRVCGNV